MPTRADDTTDLAPINERIRDALVRYWGFSELRPLQHEAIIATLNNRDALTVLPTGGGKSLCYQLPPLLRDPGEPSLCLVVSPLIALMKDQVDGLKLNEYPAAALHSSVSPSEAADIRREVEAGKIKTLFVSPERLLTDGFLAWLVRLSTGRDRSRAVACIAIDEAHCISQWGHDFRPEYRRLAELREVLPGLPIQAYTATATPRVREDIVAQLKLRDAKVLVGTFDRPNLTYRILPRIGSGTDQVEQILRRHSSQAKIVYCISRKQTEQLAEELTARGLKAKAYHAGLDPNTRHRIQEAFANERLDIVVATVAFGMGIDRSDVRCVVHASMPKSVEAYQQETGRAGRDGLASECVLLYSASDAAKWTQLVDRSAAESEVHVPPEIIEAQKKLIHQMQRVAASGRCRHRTLSEYFGQEYVPPTDSTLPGCGACDVCLGELEPVPNSTDVARKILSCVYRLQENRDMAYGAAYIAEVLRGAGVKKVIERGHHLLSTFGLLRGMSKDDIVSLIDQLIDHDLLVRDTGDLPVIRLTAGARPVLRGDKEVTLIRTKADDQIQQTATRAKPGQLVGLEQALFDELRALRRTIAEELNVPPYIVFGDVSLEDMCRVRPSTLEAFGEIRGVGGRKLEQFGERFVDAISSFCRQHNLATDQLAADAPRPRKAKSVTEPKPPSDVRLAAARLFSSGYEIDAVAAKLARARSTAVTYLVDYIVREKPASIDVWVKPSIFNRVRDKAIEINEDRLGVLFEQLDAQVTYDEIKISLALMRSRGETVPYRQSAAAE